MKIPKDELCLGEWRLVGWKGNPERSEGELRHPTKVHEAKREKNKT
jgi:hypothetical protein